MLKKSLPRALLLLFLATGSAANAGVLPSETLASTAGGNTRILEIDATRPSGDWANATTIGAPAENMALLDLAEGVADLGNHAPKVDFFTGNSNATVASPQFRFLPGGELPAPLTPLALVSEPRTAAMLLGGLAVMGLVSRRRKRN